MKAAVYATVVQIPQQNRGNPEFRGGNTTRALESWVAQEVAARPGQTGPAAESIFQQMLTLHYRSFKMRLMFAGKRPGHEGL